MTIEMTRIPHYGGENPVREGETCATVWLRDGKPLHGNGDGSYLRWSHEGNAGDIIAYAVTPERKPETVAEPRETLRDRVAMAALTGLLAGSISVGLENDPDGPRKITRLAGLISDAFMAARGDA